jgi:SAM-dependent methyltransferase
VSANPYNSVAYLTLPRQKTHPDRLAATGLFFGMTPAPVTACRVLEIGCGNGNNLIPMAYSLPGSHFTGIDLADEPIRAGRQMASDLGLTNVSLLAVDLRDFGADSGQFDYIVAHGVYSWVPAEIRDSLMALCNRLLAPQGIAFISYNAYPGRHVRQMLREMLRYHVREIADPQERVREARRFLELFLAERLLAPAWAEVVDGEIKALLRHGEGGLFHDDLAEINDSFYFRDFAAHAARHSLQYLGEADFHEMYDPRGALSWLQDTLEREQYLDFLRLRRFRQTLLCRSEIRLERKPGPAIMERFWFSAPARKIEGGQIEGLHGVRISAVHDDVNRVTGALGETYPLPLSFEELSPYAGDRAALQEILLALVTGGFADFHVYDFPCEDTVTERPRASRLVRYQAARSRYLTSAPHHIVELDEVTCQLVPLLDGTRTLKQLAQDLAKLARGATPAQIQETLPGALGWLAQQGLLEA